MTLDPGGVERVLAAIAARLAAADRLTPATEEALLTSLAGVAVAALGSQAASIAVYEPAADRLVFRAAAGPAAGDIVGVALDPGVGIAGYAFTTGQPLAVADVSADPRFERSVAEATGYVPSSLLAVPIVDAAGAIGVLEALDAQSGTFTLHDIDVATAVAEAVAQALGQTRLTRDVGTLLERGLRGLAGTSTTEDDAAADALISRAIAGLPGDDDPTWRLADRIVRLREADPEAMDLVVDWLDALLRHGLAGRRPR
ncbi:MAG TPA: GAF domain-containing protein [Candidatus Limnocylindrales bacterium]|nr:GAF domain-containing protein [Candidatus Limnocylindrales bacterium]